MTRLGYAQLVWSAEAHQQLMGVCGTLLKGARLRAIIGRALFGHHIGQQLLNLHDTRMLHIHNLHGTCGQHLRRFMLCCSACIATPAAQLEAD